MWMPQGYFTMPRSKDVNENKKVQPRLSPLLYRYLEDLVATELYGSDKTQVARTLIEEGIKRAIADRHIELRKPAKRARLG